MRLRRNRFVVAIVVCATVGAGAFSMVSLAAGNLKLRATGFSSFNTKTLSTTPGTVTITMLNRNSEDHNVAIKGKGIKTRKGRVVGQGGKSSVTVTLKRGKYTFFCSEPGHELAGMKGTLTVR